MSHLRPRIGIAFAGDPTNPTAWSGIPAGIRAGLLAGGCEPVPLSAAPPAPLALAVMAAAAIRRRSAIDAGYGPALARLRGASLRRRLAREEPLDAIVQIGSEYELPPGPPFAYLCDMTLAQARREHPVFSRLSEPVFDAWNARQKRIAIGATACLAASTWAAGSLVEDYGVPEARVHFVGLGANHLPPCRERDWGTPRFLFVGREWGRKNGPELIRAFAKLRGELPDAHLDVVGRHPPLNEAGVSGHGELSLAREDHRLELEGLFSRATCFVMPSTCEPLGIVHIEAAFAGVPSIGTTVGGVRDVIGEDAGLLVPPGDESALYAAMAAMAKSGAAREMGAAAKRRAPHFTWEKVGERIMRALGMTQ